MRPRMNEPAGIPMSGSFDHQNMAEDKGSFTETEQEVQKTPFNS